MLNAIAYFFCMFLAWNMSWTCCWRVGEICSRSSCCCWLSAERLAVLHPITLLSVCVCVCEMCSGGRRSLLVIEKWSAAAAALWPLIEREHWFQLRERVCVCVRERERESVCVCVRERELEERADAAERRNERLSDFVGRETDQMDDWNGQMWSERERETEGSAEREIIFLLHEFF